MAIMELNYQNFFVAGQRQPDLRSIMVHELGHLLGLDHTCATGAKAGFPDCNQSSLSAEYFEAVMYPVIPFDSTGAGAVKRDLNRNDQGRAQCLYGATAL
jgi:hypothetical protein